MVVGTGRAPEKRSDENRDWKEHESFHHKQRSQIGWVNVAHKDKDISYDSRRDQRRKYLAIREKSWNTWV